MARSGSKWPPSLPPMALVGCVLIFEEVEKRKNKADIVIKCAFLEIYNEELHDLLDHQTMGPGGVIDRFI